MFSDGSLDYANRSKSEGRTFVSPETFSSLAEIRANPEFDAAEIEKDEFEEIWSKATAQASRT